MSETVAIVGTGLVGRAWAIAFARAGWQCRLHDTAPGAAAAARERIGPLVDDLVEAGLLDDAAPVLARITVADDLASALADVAWVQESVPEDVAIKKALWAELDRLAPADALLVSSTSAIVPSRFTENLAGRHRCLVAHPLNPPYVIPAAELVPAPWTDDAVMQRARAVMESIGMAPIVMKKELDGFVMNRLQGALLEEAFRLVDEGYCSAEDVDRGLKDGLALRWSFMGPFETIDLNAPGGVADYCRRYEQIYQRLQPTMLHRADWNGPVLERIVAERRAKVPQTALADRQRWRDRRLMALTAHKRNAARDIGD
ncbi:MAG: 3-hydroxyacyl-CoA dehydrogenase [Geminicoccaceae bacterium]|jgi:3-hydroxyacyl-CoA dehydrogenase|nr:3-hydroxyacyl-CoA dehydrogenase [Geminicoccaceae bacterium]MCB9968337.1 3-hydroxyacyl-CoA dehydrogenase [Geminicoccaceae bacterium]HRY24601.1 3-hydroxyacyl-CoA dehydrogenase [Geminicoccaceae bacterium]